ncbi:MBL fold metallo-hydrolase [Desulfonema magnum]|uniref:Beta-lactamase domain-containing protein n=1 Tax=Desulfonema magnum TaxID=45655 RepID=A0A975BW75_9BACT|nr:ribonuclease Z [Desulfonema magnum]QTA92930.1 Beta-lactamase domain-containing protein [Desulfonema magnum]
MSLDTKKEISVTILGSGTCVPSLTRSACAALMEIGKTKLLFDVGPGTMRQLLKADTTIFDIAFIFLSHFHPDHSGELVPFLFSNKYSGGKQRKTSLTIVAGKGFFQFYNKLKNVYGHWIEPDPEFFKIIELDNRAFDRYKFNDFTVESAPVEHNEESLAYKISSSGGISVVYSGDTDFSENLIKLARDAELFICESALPDNLKVRGHLTPCLAGEIATQANVKRLMLTHFYPECEHADIEKECRKTYTGQLALAEDMMKITIC